MRTLLMRIPVLVSVIGFILALASIVGGCGPKAFTKGEYDDPTRVELLDDKFNESDMQHMADTIIKSMVTSQSVTSSAVPPVLFLERVANRTQEHIDMVSLTDKIRTSLIKSGKVK